MSYRYYPQTSPENHHSSSSQRFHRYKRYSPPPQYNDYGYDYYEPNTRISSPSPYQYAEERMWEEDPEDNIDPYLLFYERVRKRNERLGTGQVHRIARELWDNMNDNQKSKYYELARKVKKYYQEKRYRRLIAKARDESKKKSKSISNKRRHTKKRVVKRLRTTKRTASRKKYRSPSQSENDDSSGDDYY